MINTAPTTRRTTNIVPEHAPPGGGFVGGCGGVVGGGEIVGGGVDGGRVDGEGGCENAVGSTYRRQLCGDSLPEIPPTWVNHPVKVSVR